MKSFAKYFSVLAASLLLSVCVNAGNHNSWPKKPHSWPPTPSSSVPEMDAGMATMALSLFTGIIVFVAERRRRR